MSRFRKALDKFKGLVWKSLYGPLYRIRYTYHTRQRKALRILDSRQTIHYILKTGCSVCRYGDGEFQMIKHLKQMQGEHAAFNIDTFQNFDRNLAQRLDEVLHSTTSNCLVCIPHGFCNSTIHRGYDRIFVEREYLECRELVEHLEHRASHLLIGDSYFTRFYLNRTDIHDYSAYVSLLKQLWNRREVLIVEGTHSRLGVGNDLFDNTSSIRRILAPATNAFSCYDKLIDEIEKVAGDSLILLALGQTATVLAYDLAQKGFQAIDIGHVDIEYEWMRMKATEKVAVPNKYVNEVKEGRIDTGLDDAIYHKQIIAAIDSAKIE